MARFWGKKVRNPKLSALSAEKLEGGKPPFPGPPGGRGVRLVLYPPSPGAGARSKVQSTYSPKIVLSLPCWGSIQLSW